MPKKVVPAELRNRVSKFNILLNFFVFDKLLFVIFIKNKLKFHMIKKFSSPKIRNRQFVFTPKIEYKLVAKRCEANQNSLTFSFWCPRRESNSHGLPHAILSRARLPIPPPGQRQ